MTRAQPRSVPQVSVVSRRRRVSAVNEHGSVGHLVSAATCLSPTPTTPAAFVVDDVNDADRGVMKVRDDSGRMRRLQDDYLLGNI